MSILTTRRYSKDKELYYIRFVVTSTLLINYDSLGVSYINFKLGDFRSYNKITLKK